MGQILLFLPWIKIIGVSKFILKTNVFDIRIILSSYLTIS